MRFFIELSYKGTHYHGWQIQPNAISVQEVLEEKFSIVLRKKTEITGAGRTDTGVHASHFVAHFDTDTAPEYCESFVHKLNTFLPKDIALSKMYRVTDTAHSRFDALARTYHYYIHTAKNPFLDDRSWHFHHPLDLTAMNKAALRLLDYSDFTSFSRTHTQVKTNLCKIDFAHWQPTTDGWVFAIKADRFLRNMVRAIVGTLVEVGLGKLTEQQFCNIIEIQNRSKAGSSAPAQGLFLSQIDYPNTIRYTAAD